MNLQTFEKHNLQRIRTPETTSTSTNLISTNTPSKPFLNLLLLGPRPHRARGPTTSTQLRTFIQQHPPEARWFCHNFFFLRKRRCGPASVHTLRRTLCRVFPQTPWPPVLSRRTCSIPLSAPGGRRTTEIEETTIPKQGLQKSASANRL